MATFSSLNLVHNSQKLVAMASVKTETECCDTLPKISTKKTELSLVCHQPVAASAVFFPTCRAPACQQMLSDFICIIR
ncbi:hypothetical protein M514_21591 [Trichuris suis]|uniref:Uncharacterized protein n=1 Tax=Trichuris suis TaxID=68888 RepID=A0A085NA08_9BILA|nr:hypothetical protein M514_21591 [Trichuris suis]